MQNQYARKGFPQRHKDHKVDRLPANLAQLAEHPDLIGRVVDSTPIVGSAKLKR